MWNPGSPKDLLQAVEVLCRKAMRHWEKNNLLDMEAAHCMYVRVRSTKDLLEQKSITQKRHFKSTKLVTTAEKATPWTRSLDGNTSHKTWLVTNTRTKQSNKPATKNASHLRLEIEHTEPDWRGCQKTWRLVKHSISRTTFWHQKWNRQEPPSLTFSTKTILGTMAQNSRVTNYAVAFLPSRWHERWGMPGHCCGDSQDQVEDVPFRGRLRTVHCQKYQNCSLPSQEWISTEAETRGIPPISSACETN